MVNRRSWNEFRETGLFQFINSILHAFGWAIVIETNDVGDVVDVYPARVKFRGFDEGDTKECYKRIGNYMHENADELYNDVNG